MQKLKSVVVCIAKKEEDYIGEWIDYHLKLGFDKIVVFKNDWDFKVNNPRVLEIDFNGTNQQIISYNTFIFNFKDQVEWAAFIDVDEYICLKRHKNIREFLAEYDHLNCIGINWKLFGDSGLTTPDKGVVKRFTKCGGDNSHLKMILRPSINPVFFYPHSTNKQWTTTNNQKGFGPLNHSPDYNTIQLNHYFCKTREEYTHRRSIGRADTPVGHPQHIRGPNEFDAHNFNDFEDNTAKDFYLNH